MPRKKNTAYKSNGILAIHMNEYKPRIQKAIKRRGSKNRTMAGWARITLIKELQKLERGARI